MKVISSLRGLSRVGLLSSATRTQSARVTPIVRMLSISPKSLNVVPELKDALSREIVAEKELSQHNLGGNVTPAFKGFQVTQKEAEVRLTKTHGSEQILVVFNVNHSVDVSEDFEDVESADAAPVPIALPPFSIEITKGDQRLCFHMELVESADSEQPGEYDYRVEEFYIAPAVKGGNEDVPAEVYASSGRYIDTQLHDLLFLRYLEERGFDAEFCKTLVQFATHYEHEQYVNLLTKIQNFISK
ncbi:hypothetical protein WR25_14161 [Diploscapter pachys]|uniref:Uncharacterized protein n=1 Tax=Diploscapter pachys TaxID=2018661 RepID=A0A2A2JNX6_9BILA|nr:hypothetical protein WR25_14161 [Diploscapter pachys]